MKNLSTHEFDPDKNIDFYCMMKKLRNEMSKIEKEYRHKTMSDIIAVNRAQNLKSIIEDYQKSHS